MVDVGCQIHLSPLDSWMDGETSEETLQGLPPALEEERLSSSALEGVSMGSWGNTMPGIQILLKRGVILGLVDMMRCYVVVASLPMTNTTTPASGTHSQDLGQCHDVLEAPPNDLLWPRGALGSDQGACHSEGHVRPIDA